MRTGQKPGWLVVNADDFGVSRGSTLGIIKAHREGIVTSASLCVTTPHYEFAVEQAQTCPDLGIGLHFSLTSGRPVSDPRHIPMLVNKRGEFALTFSSLLFSLSSRKFMEPIDQIELELEAQFERLKRDGIQPDHVNGERHVHLIPKLFRLAVAVARNYDVPFVRAARDISRSLFNASDLASLAVGGGLVKWGLLSALTAKARRHLQGIASADHLASYMYTGRTGAFLPKLLATEPPTGVTELMVHPALPNEDKDLALGNRELERYVASQDRRDELDACIAARGKTGAWQLTNFRQLAARRTT